MNWKLALGRLANWPVTALLRARWFPLLGTFKLHENWAYDVCRFAGTRDLQIVFDVGANTGQTAQFAARFFPTATIHSFEPVAETFNALVANVSGLPRVHAHPLALGSTEELREIVLQDESELNSLQFTPDAAGAGRRIERIRVTTIDSFCRQHEIEVIDVLKTDAQGFDVEVMRGATRLMQRGAIAFIYTEVGFQPGDVYNTPFSDVHRHLQESGFKLAGFYEQVGLEARRSVLAFCNALYVHPAAVERRFGRARK